MNLLKGLRCLFYVIPCKDYQDGSSLESQLLMDTGELLVESWDSFYVTNSMLQEVMQKKLKFEKYRYSMSIVDDG